VTHTRVDTANNFHSNRAPGDNSDVYLRPCAVFPDPFRGGDNILVLTECWDSDGTPNKFNYRHECDKLMQTHKDQKPWFGLEYVPSPVREEPASC
jgi:glutamine synthetase